MIQSYLACAAIRFWCRMTLNWRRPRSDQTTAPEVPGFHGAEVRKNQSTDPRIERKLHQEQFDDGAGSLATCTGLVYISKPKLLQPSTCQCPVGFLTLSDPFLPTLAWGRWNPWRITWRSWTSISMRAMSWWPKEKWHSSRNRCWSPTEHHYTPHDIYNTSLSTSLYIHTYIYIFIYIYVHWYGVYIYIYSLYMHSRPCIANLSAFKY